MGKGFSINGYLFLLILLSLFAMFFVSGGIKSRQENRSLVLKVQVIQDELKQSQLQYQFMSALRDSVISQMKDVIDNSLLQVEQYRGIYEEAVKRETAVRRELKELKSNDAVWWTNPRYLTPYDGIDHMEPYCDTIIIEDNPIFHELR